MTDAKTGAHGARVHAASASARVRFFVCLGVGIAVGIIVGLLAPLRYALLAAPMSLSAGYTGWSWVTLRRFDPVETRQHARREDAGLALTDVAILLAVTAALGSVAVLFLASQQHRKNLDAALAVLGVVLSWFLLHTMYVGRYARLYFADDEKPGGIDFNSSDDQPTYRDFSYFAFNLGMTYQVSDTAVSDPRIRQAVLRHCLMSYFFSTLILACAINLVVNLASS